MKLTALPSITNSNSSVVKSVSIPDDDPLSRLFAGSLYDMQNGDYTADEDPKVNRFAVGNTERPTDIVYRVTRENNWWFMYAKMFQYRQEVSVLSSIISRSVTELTRYDLIFEPKFAYKCTNCGYEAQHIAKECPVCHATGTALRRPDPSQKEYFRRPNGKSFIEEANNNGQSLKDVIRSYAEMQYLCNQGYVVCCARDMYEVDSGHRNQMLPIEFISLDPVKVQNLFDDSGTPGTMYAFTMDDRHTMIDIANDHDKIELADRSGKQLYPAAWKVGENLGAAGKYWLYTQEEIYQDHWFRPALTYGIPIWYDIDDDLQTFHYLEKHFLKKYKYGYVRKILILPGFGDDSVEEVTKGITDVLATNDNSIPIVCTPPQLSGVAEMQAQALDLGTENSQDALSVKNDIRDRLCAHIGVPNLFAGDVEQSGGMNNESQQITVYDRYLMDKMAFIDRLCAWMLSWFPQITDWNLVLDRPTKAMSDAKKRLDKLQEAQMLKQIGCDIEFVDGELYHSSEPIDQIQRKEQEKAMQSQMMGGAPITPADGILPGDGEGPPEKGSARRDDAELNASKDEIEQSMREAI